MSVPNTTGNVVFPPSALLTVKVVSSAGVFGMYTAYDQRA